MRRIVVVVAVLVWVLVGCGGSDDPGHVDREEFEAEGWLWPLVADEAVVSCYVRDGLVRAVVEIDGERYALNGWALADGIQDLTPEVWLLDEEFMAQMQEVTGEPVSPSHISIQDMQAAAMEACRE